MDLLENRLIGGIDADSNEKNISNAESAWTRNMRSVSNKSSSSGDYYNILGNEYAFHIPNLEKRNKRIKLNVNVINNATPTISFKASANSAAITTASITVVQNDLDTSVSNIVAAIDTALTSAGYEGADEISREIINPLFSSFTVELKGITISATEYFGIDWITYDVQDPITFLGVVQEAIPKNMEGKFTNVGSFSIENELFVYSTPIIENVSERIIINATAATPIVITESVAHGLTTGDEVLIPRLLGNGRQVLNGTGKYLVNVLSSTTYSLIGSNSSSTIEQQAITSTSPLVMPTGEAVLSVSSTANFREGDDVWVSGTGDTAIDGKSWQIRILTSTEMVLTGSLTSSITLGGTVVLQGTRQKDFQGYLEIGIAEKSLEAWSYIRLLGTKEFNDRSKHMVDGFVERTAEQTNFYFTNNLDKPRAFYYKGDYITDGAIIETTWQTGQTNKYYYDTLAAETNYILSIGDFDISVTQASAGGNLKSGKYQYFPRLSADGSSFSPPTWSSGTFPTYSASVNFPLNLVGDEAGTDTGKINNIYLSGISSNFRYVKMLVAYYTDGAVFTYELPSQEILKNGTALVIHAGLEDTVPVPIGNLFLLYPDIARAEHMRAIDNRALLGNISYNKNNVDLRDFAKTFTHSIQRSQDIGGVNSILRQAYAEYVVPDNVANKTGYTILEKYRFGIQFRWKATNEWTPTYWVDDVEFTTGASGRRTSGLADLSLTDDPATPQDDCQPYVIFPRFSNINFDFQVEGVRIRDMFDKIRFVRQECNPTVLATGLCILTQVSAGVNRPNDSWCDQNTPSPAANPATTLSVSANRQVVITQFPDVLIGHTSIDYVSGDRLINFGQAKYQNIFNGSTGTSTLTEHYGTIAAVPYEDVAVNSIETISGQDLRAQSLIVAGVYQRETYWLTLATGITNVNSSKSSDYGIYHCVYYRPNANQYNDNSAYYPCMEYDILSSSSAASTFDVFGGDSFTQKTFFQSMFSSSVSGGCTWVSMYSQNKANIQLRYLPDSATSATGIGLPKGNGGNNDAYGRITEAQFWNVFENRIYDEANTYMGVADPSYSYSEIGQGVDFTERIAFSPRKQPNSLNDVYRTVNPLDYYDLPANDGRLSHMEIINGELYTFQPNAFTRQYFNSRATINAGEDSTSILLTSGAAFSIDGKKLSSIGTKHKWGVIKGKSLSGYDTLAWLNSESKKAVKFDAGGTSVISIKKMTSFFTWALSLAQYMDDFPAYGQGIFGIWNDRYSEYIWTIRYVSEQSEYDAAVGYTYNNVIKYTPKLYQRNFHLFPDLYICFNPTGSGIAPDDPTGDDYWHKIPLTPTEFVILGDNQYLNYYNCITMTYNELKDQWEHEASFMPKTYLRHQDTYLTFSPVRGINKVYENDRGANCNWYREYIKEKTITKAADSLTVTTTTVYDDIQPGFMLKDSSGTYLVVREIISNTQFTVDEYTLRISSTGVANVNKTAKSLPYSSVVVQLYGALTEDAIITPVARKNVEYMHFQAQEYNMDLPPLKGETATKEYESLQEETNFVSREDVYDLPMRLAQNGSANYGRWLKMKMFIRHIVPNSIHSIITKTKSSGRRINT